jgi:hypothetical protein
VEETCKTPNQKKTHSKKDNFNEYSKESKDEIAILTANAKFNHTTCKIDTNIPKLTPAYIEDTTKLVELLKNRISLLMDTTS